MPILEKLDHQPLQNPELFEDTSTLDLKSWLGKTTMAGTRTDVMFDNDFDFNGFTRLFEGLTHMASGYMSTGMIPNDWQNWAYKTERTYCRLFTPDFIVPGLDTGSITTRLHIADLGMLYESVIYVEKLEANDDGSTTAYEGPNIQLSESSLINNRSVTMPSSPYPEDVSSQYWNHAMKTLITAHAQLVG